MDPYTHSNLYHFVGFRTPTDHAKNVETIRKILKSRRVTYDPKSEQWGFQSFECRHDRPGLLLKGELIVPNMVCFCDIPPTCLGVHMGKYGRCGISLKREHLLRHGARPVIYFPFDPSDHTRLGGVGKLTNIEETYNTLVKSQANCPLEFKQTIPGRPAQAKLLQIAVFVLGWDLLAFIKPFDATLPIEDPNNFYMEREWRRVGNMCFEPEHVGHIVVPEEFVEPLRQEFPEFGTKIEDVTAHANPPI